MSELIEFEVLLTPNVKAESGRIYTQVQFDQMIAYLDSVNVTKQGYVTYRDQEQLNRSIITNNIETVDLKSLKGIIEGYRITSENKIVISLRPIFDNFLKHFKDLLELRTLFIGSVERKEDGNIYVSDDSKFIYFYVRLKNAAPTVGVL